MDVACHLPHLPRHCLKPVARAVKLASLVNQLAVLAVLVHRSLPLALPGQREVQLF